MYQSGYHGSNYHASQYYRPVTTEDGDRRVTHFRYLDRDQEIDEEEVILLAVVSFMEING